MEYQSVLNRNKSKVKRKVSKEQEIGTLKVLHLNGDTQVQGLPPLLYSDLKPFYIMTNPDPKNEWIKKKRLFWRKDRQRMGKIEFHHLSIIDEYN